MKMTRLCLVGLLAVTASFAQSSGGEFEIVKSSIDNGGGVAAGGAYSLTGTVGQPDAQPQVAKGGDFALAGGFWGNAAVIDLLFRDSFEDD